MIWRTLESHDMLPRTASSERSRHMLIRKWIRPISAVSGCAKASIKAEVDATRSPKPTADTVLICLA